jgi:hypothetical protein
MGLELLNGLPNEQIAVVTDLVTQGKNIMTGSLDPEHGYDHPERMEQIFEKHLADQKPKPEELAALYLAIWHHDRSKAVVVPNRANFLVMCAAEGFISTAMFLNDTQKIDPRIKKTAAQAIFLHPSVLLPKFTWVDKQVSDLDLVDLFHWPRWEKRFKKFKGKLVDSPGVKFILSFTEKHIFHEPYKDELAKKRKEFLSYIN